MFFLSFRRGWGRGRGSLGGEVEGGFRYSCVLFFVIYKAYTSKRNFGILSYSLSPVKQAPRIASLKKIHTELAKQHIHN